MTGTPSDAAAGHWHTPGGTVPCCEIDDMERELLALRASEAEARRLLVELSAHLQDSEHGICAAFPVCPELAAVRAYLAGRPSEKGT